MTNQKTPVQGGVTEEQIEAAARAIWERYAGPGPWETVSPERQAPFRRDARVALSAAASAHPADEHHDAEEREAESEDHAATVTGGREKLALDRVWKAMGCAWNPDAFKAGVRDTMWSQVVEFCEEQTASNNRLHRENEELRTALAAPVEVNEAKLAEVIAEAANHKALSWGTLGSGYTVEGVGHLAHAVAEWLRGEGRG